MSLLLLLGLGGLGAAVTTWTAGREPRIARTGTVAGALALLLLLVAAFALEGPTVGPDGVPSAPNGLFGGTLVPTDYLRLAVSLWALDALLLVVVGWLLGGLASLRGLLGGTLAGITGGAVALAAADGTLGIVAATAAGLASLVFVLAVDRAPAIRAAADELRVVLGTGALLLAAAAVAPIAAALVLNAGGNATGTAGVRAEEGGAFLGIAALAITLAVAVRAGSIPFHVRVPRLADVVPPVAMPLLLGWAMLPLAVVALAALDALVAPIALPLEGERAVILALALFTMVAAAIAAFIQDDLRHGVGYLVIADGGLVLLGFAALDPGAWGPTRTWLLALAASKAALGGWAAVTEARFETRSLPDLRGWIRRAPILATGLAVAAVATFGLPGWAAFAARGDLARLAAATPLDLLLALAGFVTLPTYLRLLAIGFGPASSRVSRAAPERIRRGRRPAETLAVTVETSEPRGGGTQDAGDEPGRDDTAGTTRARRLGRVVPPSASLGRRLGDAIRRDRTELLSAAVLALAILAALTSWGALNVGGASAEPAPVVASSNSD